MAEKRNLSVVMLKAKLVSSAESTVTLSKAFTQTFGFTKALRLQRETGTQYQAGNVKRRLQILSARVTPIRSMRAVSSRLGQEGYELDDADDVSVSDGSAVLCMDIHSGVTALWERATFPHTRLNSFAKRASLATSRPWRLAFEPIRSDRKLRDWIEHFETISEISFLFRHSQSPGDRFVDAWFDNLNASLIKETITARPGESLTLTPPEVPDPQGDENASDASDERAMLPVERTIEHLQVNPNNGKAIIKGAVGEDRITVDTREQVERVRTVANDTTYEAAAVALAGLVRNFQ